MKNNFFNNFPDRFFVKKGYVSWNDLSAALKNQLVGMNNGEDLTLEQISLDYGDSTLTTFQIKRGLRAQITSLLEGEMAFATDTKEFLIGYNNAIINLNDSTRITTTINSDNKWVINGIVTQYVAKGDKGDKGDQGLQGIQGIQGPKGDKGDQGSQGIQGIQGVKGDTGDQGLQGLKGEGVPYPLGSEGQILAISNAAPTWKTVTYSASNISLTNIPNLTASNVQDAIQKVFQFANDTVANMQTTYANAIVGKNGTISKAGTVYTENEIKAGINSIPDNTTVNTRTEQIRTILLSKSCSVQNATWEEMCTLLSNVTITQ